MANTNQTTTKQSKEDDFIKPTATIKLPVATDDRGLIPRNSAYSPIRQIGKTGFSFKFINLLHAIGCKTASLSSSKRKRCISSAYLFNELLRLDTSGNIYSRELGDPDLQTPRSQEIGIGVLCLFARSFWAIPWDSLESIPGRGKRFDYRGKGTGLKAIFEAKGTRYRSNQFKQITDGLKKKKEHHKRGEKFDIELIVSTHVGGARDKSRILLADPEFSEDDFTFGPESAAYFRLRHYARVLHFAGAPILSYQTYQEAENLRKATLGFGDLVTFDSLRPVDFRYQRSLQFEVSNLATQTINENSFLGTWYESSHPAGDQTSGQGRKHIKNHNTPQGNSKFRLFQGIRSEIIAAIEQQGPTALLSMDLKLPSDSISEEDKSTSSVFSDGSTLCMEHT